MPRCGQTTSFSNGTWRSAARDHMLASAPLRHEIHWEEQMCDESSHGQGGYRNVPSTLCYARPSKRRKQQGCVGSSGSWWHLERGRCLAACHGAPPGAPPGGPPGAVITEAPTTGPWHRPWRHRKRQRGRWRKAVGRRLGGELPWGGADPG